MSFKKISILFVFIAVSGCSEFINGPKKKDEVLKFSEDRFACLNDVPQSLRNMVADESTPEKMDKTLICLEESLSYFKKRTKGNVPDGYTIQDIRAFFGNYLGDRDRVTDEMAEQMMKVKQALFGGNEKVIAKSELQALIDLFTLIRGEIKTLTPYWDVILVKNAMKPHPDLVEKSHQALKVSLTKILLETNLAQSEYTFDDFKTLLTEAEKFVQRAPEKKDIDFIKWLPLIEAAKVHLFSDRADMNSSAKWKLAIEMVLDLHQIYSFYEYQYKGHDFYSKAAFKAGDRMLTLGIKLVDKSWWMDRDGIPFSETLKLLKALQDRDFLPKDTTADSIMSAYQTIVRDLLDREPENRAVKLNTLSRQHVSTLKNEYKSFKLIQNFIDGLPEKFLYVDLMKKLNEPVSFDIPLFPEISPENLKNSWRDWQNHLNQPFPMLYLPTGELLLDRNAKSSNEWSWVGLTHLNVMRFLNRVLMLSFGTQRTMDLSKEFLNEDSIKRFYSEFWDFAVPLKAFDPRSGNSGKRTFFEADHFVYAANGNEQVTVQESFELVNVIFSAGLSGLSQIQKDLNKSKCVLPEKDFFGNLWLDETCFKNVLRQKFSDYFKNLTGLKKWVATLSDSEWDDFYHELIDFSRANPNTVGKIETGDLRAMVVITHYIESMYIKFDTDRDDKLSIEELVSGSKRFVPFFKELFKLEPKGPFLRETQENLIDYAVSHAFACMVVTGEMPKVQSCSPAFFKNAVQTKAFSNRGLILKTLNAFKASIK